MGSIFFERYSELCKSAGETPNSVAKIIGASSGSVTAWKNGTEPRNKTLSKIADYFNVSTDYLLGNDDDSRMTDKAKKELADLVRSEPDSLSGDRLELLFNVSGYDHIVVCFNLGIDQGYLDRWMDFNDLPPKPIVDKILGVFCIKPEDLLSSVELAEYYKESDEWGTNKEAPALTKKDERDIANKLESIMADLEHSGDLMFDGDPMSDEARESMRNAIELGLKAVKLLNKETYTPKKYKKG